MGDELMLNPLHVNYAEIFELHFVVNFNDSIIFF
jgi:hypothetical protein